MNIGVTIECRMNSSRLPGKVLMKIQKKPILQLMIERIQSSCIKTIIVATTNSAKDDPVEKLCNELNIHCFRGSEDDVLGRVVGAATAHHIDLLLPLGADCPLIDPFLIDEMVKSALDNIGYRVFDNGGIRGYPLGLDFHAVWVEDLISAHKESKLPEENEHTTLFLKKYPDRFPLYEITAPTNLQDSARLTLDESEDFVLIEKIFNALYLNGDIFSLESILEFLRKNPDVKNINQHIQQKSI